MKKESMQEKSKRIGLREEKKDDLKVWFIEGDSVKKELNVNEEIDFKLREDIAHRNFWKGRQEGAIYVNIHKQNQGKAKMIKEKRGEFITVFQDKLEAIVKLKPTEIRLFLYILGKSKFNNIFEESQKEIAQGLNITPEAVSKGLKRLYEEKIIDKHYSPKMKQNFYYSIKENIAYKKRLKDVEI